MTITQKQKLILFEFNQTILFFKKLWCKYTAVRYKIDCRENRPTKTWNNNRKYWKYQIV